MFSGVRPQALHPSARPRLRRYESRSGRADRACKATQKATHFAPNAAQKASQHPTAPVRNASFDLRATPETQRGCAAQCERAQPRAFIPQWAILDSNQ